jgi:predicted CopG family antitoxin
MIGKKITVRVSEDAYLKLKEDAWKARKSMSDLINDIILGNKPLKDKKPKASVAIQDGTKVKDAYVAAFKARYGSSPVWAAKQNSQAKNLISLIGLEKSIWVASKYPFYNDPWHVTQKHPFGLLITQINKVLVELNDPNRMLDSTRIRSQISEEVKKSDLEYEKKELERKAKESRQWFNEFREKHKGQHFTDGEIQVFYENRGALE